MVTDVPPRLRVGVLGSGRVGAVLGAALRRVGHPVVGVTARTDLSRVRAEALLPGVPLVALEDLIAAADLLLLTVPDDALEEVVTTVAAQVRPGTYVVHVSGRHGLEALAPLAEAGAIPLALHPAMTFTGTSLDLSRLEDCPFAVTAAPAALPIAEALVIEMGGDPIVVPEESRVLYHAALVHGANHLVTLVTQTCDVLDLAGVEDPARVAGPLLRAALDNALRERIAALTGPVARGDARTLEGHLADLDESAPDIAATYRALAVATAMRAHDAGRLDAEQVRRVLATLGGDLP